MNNDMKSTVLTGKLTFQSMKPCDLSNCTKTEIKNYFENSYNLNESIFTALKDESVFYHCPDRLRLPLIFYYGHTAAVYMNKLVLSDMLKPNQRIQFEYEMLFETGVDEMSWDDTENFRMGGKFKWPKVAEVAEYRRKVRELILKLIDDTPLQLPVTPENPWWALFMGMEHERIHLETSSVLMRQLPSSMVEKPDDWIYAPLSAEEPVKENPLLTVASTMVTLGKPMDFPSYGWDNEYGSVDCSVPAFEMSKYPITNREFLEFVEADGYKKREYWSAEGWQWVNYRQAKHPTFWVCQKGCKSGCGASLSSYSHCQLQEESNIPSGDDTVETIFYKFRCIYDVIDMPWDWPAEVNYHEAKAFTVWKGSDYRLPTEAEYNAIRGYQIPAEQGTKSDIIYIDHVQANMNLKFGSSTPVNLFSPNELGFCDVFGNVWEWCEDHFNGLPGFQTFYYYDDFSTPTFDGRHNVIMGGSWMSTGDEASRFARFAFRRHFFQHLGFRIARSLPAKNEGKIALPVRLVANNVYMSGFGFPENPTLLDTNKFDIIPVETTNLHYKLDIDSLVIGEILSQYITNRSLIDNLLSICSSLTKNSNSTSPTSALHIGCGAGRLTFELTNFFDNVVGVDVSARLFDACVRLQTERQMTAIDTCDGSTARIDACIGSSLDTSRVVFKQLTWLPNEVGRHDLVLVTMLHRVQNIRAWTGRFREIVKPSSWLVLALKENWLVENVSNIISNEFSLEKATEITYVENGSSKMEFLSIWKRKVLDY